MGGRGGSSGIGGKKSAPWTGTPKQISYAQSIVEKAVDKIDAIIGKRSAEHTRLNAVREKAGYAKKPEDDLLQQFRAAKVSMKSMRDAKEIIDIEKNQGGLYKMFVDAANDRMFDTSILKKQSRKRKR